MNYTDVLRSIKQASLFDLYRLNVAIQHELANPTRIAECRNLCAVGDTIHYFDAKANMQKEGILVEKKSKYVILQSPIDHKLWKIPYYLLNLHNVNTDIGTSAQEKLSRNTLKKGDGVGFNHDGKLIVGKILRLNSKSVSLLTPDNRRWRVGYSLLFRYIDAEFEKSFNQDYLRIVINEA
jgi:hypothetical protein